MGVAGAAPGYAAYVPDQKQDAAHGGELGLPVPDSQDLHYGYVDDRGADTDDELPYDHEGEIVCGGRCRTEYGPGCDKEYEYRSGLPRTELIREDPAGDLHQRIRVEICRGQEGDGCRPYAEEVLQRVGDRSARRPMEVYEEVCQRKDREYGPTIGKHTLLLL